MLWLLPLKRYFQFSGRSGRGEYWQFVGFYIVFVLICAVIDDSTKTAYNPSPTTLMSIAAISLIVPVYAVTFRRLHDRNLSGWLTALQFATGFVGGFCGAIHDRLAGSIVGVPFLLVQYAAYLASFAASAFTVWQLCLPGDAGDNRFGPPPIDTAENAPKLNEVAASVSERVRGFAPPPAPPSTPPSGPDAVLQLERLAKLHRDGAITDEEFARQKAALLGS